MGVFQRLVWAGSCMVLVGLLLTAYQLQPNSQGHGTHQQLGLPPCTAIVVWGVRCPACGMTTSWAYFTNLQWGESFRVNAGGFVFALIATAVAPCLGWFSFRGQSAPQWSVAALALALVAGLFITGIDWAMRFFG